MSARLLLLTAGFGEGHNAAARALAAAANDMVGAGSARVVDVFALARPRTNELVRRGYLGMINRAPQVWRRIYRWLDRSPRGEWLLAGLGAEVRTLATLIELERPTILCSTYPIYAFMLPRVQARLRKPLPPHFNVVTDSITINSLWWRKPCAGWFVPNSDSAEVLRDAGVPASAILTRGFPVAPFFADEQERLSPPSPAAWERPRVLYIVNSRTPAALETAFRLVAEDRWAVTCTVGRNDELRAQLEHSVAGRRGSAKILGWTSAIPRLLMTHHVVVSKAGGATTQESIAAHCPMIVNQIVPGQEEGNYELLRRHGIGALAQTPDEVMSALERAFAHDASEWRRWRAALSGISRPNAAREIVRTLLSYEQPQPAGSGRTWNPQLTSP